MMPRVSRLYVRMAVYIGAAIVGFVLLALASLALIASRQLENYLLAREGSLGRDAAQILASGGREALREWMTDPRTVPDGVVLYILDAQGRDVAGKTLPASYRRFVERFVLAGVRSDERYFSPIRLAPLLVAADGTRYAFLLVPERIAPWGNAATLVAVLAAALIVIAVVAALIARALGRPIRELQVTVRSIAKGEVAARASAAVMARGDELGALARDVDGMAERIERLLASRQQLMRDMSHELRSPLARLQAALALAERKQPLPAIEHARIVTELERMNQAIGDVLRFTRLDAEPIRAKHLLRIDELLRTLVEDERVEAGNRDVRVVLEAASDLTVVGDPALLRSGFENVLRNAIRHAPPDSRVEVRAAAGQAAGETPIDTVEISIEDRGPGVPSEMLEQIFEPYTRLAPAGDDSTGTGLGLAIARRVFVAHGGRIHAEPATPCGLRVRMQLPRAC